MSFGWEGELVRLVPLDVDRHLENYIAWLNDSVVTEWLLLGDTPLTRLAERSWFDLHEREQGSIIFAVETLAGDHIGGSGLHGVDHRNGTANTGSFIGNPSAWGKGYGSDAARVRTRYAFEVLGLRMLYSSYFDGNVRSARMQERVGYKVYGKRPQSIWKRGAFRDEVLTYLSRDEWQEARS